MLKHAPSIHRERSLAYGSRALRWQLRLAGVARQRLCSPRRGVLPLSLREPRVGVLPFHDSSIRGVAHYLASPFTIPAKSVLGQRAAGAHLQGFRGAYEAFPSVEDARIPKHLTRRCSEPLAAPRSRP